MKQLKLIALMALFAGMFSACTHYTLPQDPAEQDFDLSESEAVSEVSKEDADKSLTMDPALADAQAQPAAIQPMVAQAAPVPVMECTPDDSLYINDEGMKRESIKIRSTGYGAPPKSFYPDPQRRLMAMRAAKIDAYRSLAERIYGVQIWGGTTLGDMVVERDRFRVYLDTHLRGARVVAENMHEDGSYETEVEVNVDQSLLSIAIPQKAKAKPARTRNNPCPDGHKPVMSNGSGYTLSHASYTNTPRRVDPMRESSNTNFYYSAE